MEKPQLPIDDLSIEDFDKFKEKYLNSSKLDPEAIKKIENLFDIGAPDTGKISCDDYHEHTYGCVYFYHPSSGVVNRLLNEIQRQKGLLKKINGLSSENS